MGVERSSKSGESPENFGLFEQASCRRRGWWLGGLGGLGRGVRQQIPKIEQNLEPQLLLLKGKIECLKGRSLFCSALKARLGLLEGSPIKGLEIAKDLLAAPHERIRRPLGCGAARASPRPPPVLARGPSWGPSWGPSRGPSPERVPRPPGR